MAKTSETFFQQDAIIVVYDCREPETVERWQRDREAWGDRCEHYYLWDHRVALVIRAGVGSPA